MSKTDVSSVAKHFPSAQDGYTSTLSSTVIAPAATVPINGGLAGYDDGDVVVFIVDPGDATKEQVLTGTVDTAGSQLTGVKWLRGSNTTHTAGATVVDYPEAAHVKMITKGLLAAGLTQAGGMGAITPTSVTSSGTITANSFVQTGSGSTAGWSVGVNAPNTVTALGNRSYSCVFNSVDYSTTLSAGMRLRTTRTVAAPTQSTSLNGTTQYYSKASPAGMTFTNLFTVSGWIKLSSYAASTMTIASRYNGTSGWVLALTSTGQVALQGFNAGSLNNLTSLSYQSIPLNKWVHVAAQLDMTVTTTGTTNNYIMIDGVEVPNAATRAGTSPTALIQAGNLEVGSQNGGLLPFPGKIAQVAIYSAKVTQATILASMNQPLVGTETSLISAYSFNGVITDLNTTNANNLTANGSAVATSADSPFGYQADGTISSTLDYAIIQKVAFSTNTTVTVQVPEGCTIPTSGGVSSVVYSSNKAPFGFPAQRGKWCVEQILKVDAAQSSPAVNTWYNFPAASGSNGALILNIPVGDWALYYSSIALAQHASSVDIYATLSTANNSESDAQTTVRLSGASSLVIGNLTRVGFASLSTATNYFLNGKTATATTTAISFRGASDAPTIIRAENAYL